MDFDDGLPPTGNEVYCKKCKRDVVPLKEPYNPLHTIEFMTGYGPSRGFRCPYCNKKLHSWGLFSKL